MPLIRRLLGGLHGIDGVLVNQHEALARLLEIIKGTGLNQRLGHAFGTRCQIDLVKVITKGRKRPLCLARSNDGFDDFRAHIADSAHAEANILAHSLEVLFGFIDRGRQNVNAQVAAIRQVDGGLILLIAHRGQQRCHVFRCVIGLEVGRPERDQPVARGVGLVKRVRREGLDGPPQGIHGGFRVAIFLHATPKFIVLLG